MWMLISPFCIILGMWFGHKLTMVDVKAAADSVNAKGPLTVWWAEQLIDAEARRAKSVILRPGSEPFNRYNP
jgi:hypothetical protein